MLLFPCISLTVHSLSWEPCLFGHHCIAQSPWCLTHRRWSSIRYRMNESKRTCILARLFPGRKWGFYNSWGRKERLVNDKHRHSLTGEKKTLQKLASTLGGEDCELSSEFYIRLGFWFLLWGRTAVFWTGVLMMGPHRGLSVSAFPALEQTSGSPHWLR